MDVRTYDGPGVRIVYDPGDDTVLLDLSGLAARRLMLGLGVHTRRYGPEVSALLTGLARLILKAPTSSLETGGPHGPGCSCKHCEEAFR